MTKEQAIEHINELIETLDTSEPSANAYYGDLIYAKKQIEGGADPEEELGNI